MHLPPSILPGFLPPGHIRHCPQKARGHYLSSWAKRPKAPHHPLCIAPHVAQSPPHPYPKVLFPIPWSQSFSTQASGTLMSGSLLSPRSGRSLWNSSAIVSASSPNPALLAPLSPHEAIWVKGPPPQ